MENKKFDLLDTIVLIIKYKKSILLISFLTLILSYLFIYYFIDERYDATATIIPVEENTLTGISSMLKDLPIDIGSAGFQNTELTRYNTIIYSRNVLNEVINKFDLINVYEVNKSKKTYYEKTLEILRDNINASEDENGAYIIEVSDTNPKRAAEITNYLIKLLNNKIVELKIQKSSENREFLQARLLEIKRNLRQAEDSLKKFQERTGLLTVEDQVKEILKVYSELDTKLITKQIELSILSKIRNPNSPEVDNLETQVSEYKKKLNELKNDGQENSLLLSLNSLPGRATEYLRLLRQVEINNSILEFILPLYEQAKFEEQKEVPILQVVDYAIPPAEKSFPPRTIFSMLIAFSVFLIIIILIIIRNNIRVNNSERVKYIKENLFRWNVKKR